MRTNIFKRRNMQALKCFKNFNLNDKFEVAFATLSCC